MEGSKMPTQPPTDKVTGVPIHPAAVASPKVPPNQAATTSASTLNQQNAANTAQQLQGATVDTANLLAQVDALQRQVAALQTQVAAFEATFNNHAHSFLVESPPTWGVNNMGALKDWMFGKEGGGDFSQADFPVNLNLPGMGTPQGGRSGTEYTSTPTPAPKITLPDGYVETE
jgi:hypothetical protein